MKAPHICLRELQNKSILIKTTKTKSTNSKIINNSTIKSKSQLTKMLTLGMTINPWPSNIRNS